jgi:hypothetical protein
MAKISTPTSGSRGEEMTKSMMYIVEIMLNASDREALIDKIVDRIVEISGRFDSKDIRKFLATYWNKMQLRDVHGRTQRASFK